MGERIPRTVGQLTPEEVAVLADWDIVLVRAKNSPDLWAVGDVNTLFEASMWGENWEVHNLNVVPIASMSAQRRWAAETYFENMERYDDDI